MPSSTSNNHHGYLWTEILYFQETQKNIVESDYDDGNSDGDKRKGKNPNKLGYPPGIIPILEELPKWAENEHECSQLREYLFTMNKGLEKVRGRDGPLLQQLLQII
ncbi:hypothetical protein F8M41_022083 [Gigaspora margarita]|uniref:Uncharacterized protein n=1 Tax=Gigaspora margarita TaxID=4874 RepID=A0A8H4EIB3_GIGMA|nr:hypothetical protein F8M41_022083 [Gigaspora margarita]